MGFWDRLGHGIRYVLRGVSQIFFIENAWSGAIMLVAMGWVHPAVAGLVFLGSAVQAAAAWAMRDRDAVRAGMMGYNGALVGAAAAAALGTTSGAVLMTIVGAFACVPVHHAVGRIFGSRVVGWAALPISTAPFCIVAGLLFRLIHSLAVAGVPTERGDLLNGGLLGFFNDYSEVVLADGLIPGVLIAIALFIGSRAIGFFALLGSVLALCGGFLAGYDVDHVSSGLLGYSAVLVAIALGAVIWPEKPLWARLCWVVLGVALTMAIQPLLALTMIPVYTWPFLLSMWIAVLLGRAVGRRRAGLSR